jgi:dolichol-phosphate hexosyltransferase
LYLNNKYINKGTLVGDCDLENTISNEVLCNDLERAQPPYFIDKNDVTIVIPTLNEELGLEWVIKGLRSEGFLNLLMVDGNSIDLTVEIAKKLNVKVINQEGKGKAGAIVTAIKKINTRYFAVIDGDHTYNPKDVNILLENAPFNNHVIGKRMDQKNIKYLNRFGNNMINFLFNTFFNSNLKDVCSGLYLLNTSFAKGLTIKSNGFDVEVEIAAQSAVKKTVGEVPISYSERVGIQKLNPLKDGFKIILQIFNLAKKYKPKTFWTYIASSASILIGLILQTSYLLPLQFLNQLNINNLSILFVTVGASSFFLLMISTHLIILGKKPLLK